MDDIVKEWQELVNNFVRLCTKETQKVSNCCGEPPASEWHEEGCLCTCGEHCDWEEENEPN